MNYLLLNTGETIQATDEYLNVANGTAKWFSASASAGCLISKNDELYYLYRRPLDETKPKPTKCYHDHDYMTLSSGHKWCRQCGAFYIPGDWCIPQTK